MAESTAPVAVEGSGEEPDWINSLLGNAIKWVIENESDSGESCDAAAMAILRKLQQMLQIVASKTNEISEDIPWYCFLSLIQLNERAKKRNPEYRHVAYRSGGEDVNLEELRFLSDGVDMAEWAYDEKRAILKKKLLSMSYALLRHDTSVEPGRVGHYIAINHDAKIALIGLKGTSTFSDLVTDCVGSTVEYSLEAPFDESYSSRKIRCHEGIWNAALTLADDVEDLIRNLFLPCEYQVLICGHSLGAGTACLLGLLLRSRIPALQSWHEGRLRLRVLAVATPPVLNHDAAVAATSFCTSLVNNCDIVPRMSLSNLVILSRALVAINERLKEKGMDPHDLGSVIAYTKQVLDADTDEPLFTLEEIDAFFKDHSNESYLKHADNLFVPGRVVLMWGSKKTEDGQSKDAKERSREDRPVIDVYHDSGGSSENEETSDERDKLDAEFRKFVSINAVASIGATRKLQEIEPENTFLDDHRTDFYRASIRALVQILEQQRSHCGQSKGSNRRTHSSQFDRSKKESVKKEDSSQFGRSGEQCKKKDSCEMCLVQ